MQQIYALCGLPGKACFCSASSLWRWSGHLLLCFLGGAQDILILVRHVEDCDPDEITRYHARMARGHLQGIVRKFMQPGRKMPAGVFLPSQFGH